MKRKLALLLITISLLILVSAPAYAESVDPLDPDMQESSLSLNESFGDRYDYTWTKNDDGADTYTLVLTCKGTTTDVNIRKYYGDWFEENRDRISRVVINEGAKSIGVFAFRDCRSLISVKLPSTVERLAVGAFFRCVCLNEIDLSNVTNIGESAFYNCGPDPFEFNFSSSISKRSRILACSPAYFDAISPNAPEGTTSTDQYMDAYEQMQDILSGLDLDGKSEIDKVKAIYRWVIGNITYDYEALQYEEKSARCRYAATLHSAIFARQVICEGYAVLLRAMLNEAGVGCMFVAGPTTAGSHAWNMVRVDGKWYLCDSTWDAEETEDIDLVTTTYFLRSSTFFYDNKESGHYWPNRTDVYRSIYPISTEDYYARIKKDGFTFIIAEDHAILLSYKGKATSLTLPAKVSHGGADIPVTIVGAEAFLENERLEKVVIPEGYTTILKSAFCCWPLKTIVLPSTLEKIEAEAFAWADGLYNVRYNGTSQQFLAIDIASGNGNLCSNTIHCSDGDYNDPHDLAKAKITLSKKTFVYDGKKHFPGVTVTLKGVTLEEGKDYILEYTSPGKIVAEYEAYVTGIGDYSRFEKSFTYKIIPQPTKLKKVKAGKKTLTAYWTKKTIQITGYQVQYALNKKFTKGKKTVRVSKDKGSIKIKKLKSGKRYYVRVRIRKYSSGETIESNLYSKWSNVKSVKVK